jgi:hypothetical protein
VGYVVITDCALIPDGPCQLNNETDRVSHAVWCVLSAAVRRDPAARPPRDDGVQQDPPGLHAHQVLRLGGDSTSWHPGNSSFKWYLHRPSLIRTLFNFDELATEHVRVCTHICRCSPGEAEHRRRLGRLVGDRGAVPGVRKPALLHRDRSVRGARCHGSALLPG